MGFTFKVFPAHRLRVVVLASEVTPESLRAASLDLLASSDYDPGHDVLVDARPALRMGFKGDILLDMARKFAESGGMAVRQTRLAVIADSDEQFGIARVYGAYRGGVSDQLQVFRNAADACAWLDVPESVTA